MKREPYSIEDAEAGKLPPHLHEGPGLYGKFYVARVDGRDAEGGDKADARYFVLDYIHDDHARRALAAYANSIHRENFTLACELREELAATAPAGGER